MNGHSTRPCPGDTFDFLRCVSQIQCNGALEASIKEKLNHYHHDYNERNFLFLPAVMTTSWRISCDLLHSVHTHLHTVASSSRQILHTHLHHRSITQGIQTTTWRLLLLQSRCNRTRMRTSYSHEDRHRPTQRPHKNHPSD